MSENKNKLKKKQSGQIPGFIVAIGGSTGALEALTQILELLSTTTGLAFIYIQHAFTEHETRLETTLDTLTSMPVLKAAEGLRILPDHFYIVYPDSGLEAVDGKFVLVNSNLPSESYMPVDSFFISLSEHQKDGIIGIVLSGIGSDGTLGLKAIKSAGGITIVQDESAKFQSMPMSAISEEVVDLILSPKEIAIELQRLSKNSAIFRSFEFNEEQQEAVDKDLVLILRYLKKSLGVDFENYKITTIRRRIIRRMLLFKLETFASYLQYLKLHASEANLLYGDLLINVTNFFRDTDTMAYLKDELVPKIIDNKSPGEAIRIWVAGCSTGQEAYSLAIIFLEVIGTRAANIHIFASDLSEAAIAKARLGIYSASEVQDISAGRLERFFVKVDGTYRINKAVRDLCVFAPHNLLKDPPFSRLDLVSCRNVLIYFDNQLQQQALKSFHYALNPEGHLLLGKSEGASSVASLFTQTDKNHKVFTRRNGYSAKILYDVGSYTNEAKLPQMPQKRPVSGNSPVTTIDLEQIIDDLLLTRYVPASVVVDQDLEIIQLRGSTGLFLEPSPGKPSFNLARMARPVLVLELRNLVHKARKTGLPVSRSGLEIQVNGQTHYVKIEAVPVKGPADQLLCLVLFQEIIPEKPASLPYSEAGSQRIRELEEQLAALREDMHSIIEEHEATNEELQSANEEIVSSNEELQSINEELETSKEEIESTNEELLTINQELQVRNDQLTEAYGYSEAILNTIHEATLVLDKNLRIKVANKAFHKIFRIPEQNIRGMMLYELGQRQWDISVLRQMLSNVIVNDAIINSFEVSLAFEGVGDKIMLLHARKVVQHQRQQAILLVMEDITEHRRAQKLLQERQTWFVNLINDAPTLIWVSKSSGEISFLNKAWQEFTGNQSEMDIIKHIHPEDQENYLARYSQAFLARKPLNFEYRLLRADGAYRWMLENAKPMFDSNNAFTGYIGNCVEVHLQKMMTQELNRHVDQRTRELQHVNTELENANYKLTETAESLQAVLDSSPASIGFFKTLFSDSNKVEDFKLLIYNHKFRKYFPELSNGTEYKMASDLYSAFELEKMKHVALTATNHYEEKLQENGKWLGISITKHDSGVVVTQLNITAIKESEKKQYELIQQLEGAGQTLAALESMRQYVRDRGEFLRSTSHDLRGSFGIIVGAASLLNMIDVEEDRSKTLDMLQRSLKQVTYMINQLLDYSRLESGQEELQIVSFDVSELFTELCETSFAMAQHKKLLLPYSGPQGMKIEGDVVKIRRIAQNLILNAIKYTSQGEVKISWGNEEDGEEQRWFLMVQDTGPGIPDELISKLNDSELKADHNKADGTKTEVSQHSGGEGIGLFIVKKLVNMLHAHMHIESHPERGTMFRVSFPASYPFLDSGIMPAGI
ncbi:CheR family methyltransferase [Dyadobacter sediminis]|uniref:histidine kinase n=1 Tax=Dyadobacter sediminis TaxID=1493691 RepID=A0A5R9KAJ1_9BACT|nr:CheR family methyltransferase [Dyadobacter sediminis]TLU91737.1 PAS domain S-box protein [Dyadobacter sediminis]GGC00702.1 hypothetical protein GCM10011325_29890 [Dyadobacter sediminis]